MWWWEILGNIEPYSIVALADGKVDGIGYHPHGGNIQKGICVLCTEKLITWTNPSVNKSVSELKGEQIAPADIVRVLAGIIEGLVEEDHLDHIEKCLNDTETIEKLLVLAMADFEKGDVADIIKGVKLIGQIL